MTSGLLDPGAGKKALETAGRGLAQAFDQSLFSVQGVDITPFSIVLFAVLMLLAIAIGRLARRTLIRLLVRRQRGPTGSVYAVARIAQYLVTVIGFVLALENVGVSMTSLAAVGAAFAVGLGFGLQNMAQNFISGLILLFERPISKGDVVIVDNTFGIVDEISIRATRIMTFDQIAMIVPNSKLISGVVENRSEPTTTYRIRIDIGVAYGSDTREVETLLLEVAAQQEQALKEPPPRVFFVGFGSSSLDFQLCVWLDDPEASLDVASELRHDIVEMFSRHSIRIPFPQRDVHLFPAPAPAPESDAQHDSAT